jgi:hypothetical protein
METSLSNIVHHLMENYAGMPWHGNPLKELLKNVDTTIAFYRPIENKHNIAELVAHILVWRQFVVEILDENYDAHVDIGNLEDFPELTKSEKVWQELLTQLNENQVALVNKLNRFPESKLTQNVPKKPFTFQFLFEGINFHDVYHGGQIGFIKAAFEAQSTVNADLSKKISFF